MQASTRVWTWLEEQVTLSDELAVLDGCNHELACAVDEPIEDSVRRQVRDTGGSVGDRLVADMIDELLFEQVTKQKGMWRKR